MKIVMLANMVIMATYAVCVTCAAIYFGNPDILWWYVLLGFLGFSYNSRGAKDGK